MKNSSYKSRGFTLVELLVVIAIIGILIAMLLPAVQMIREAARRTSCKNNLKQISLACHTYASAHEYLPAGWKASSETGVPGWGWASAILPYMEEENLADQINFDLFIEDPHHADAVVKPIASYFCPSDEAKSAREFLLSETRLGNGVDPHGTDHLPMDLAASNYVANLGLTWDVDNPPAENCPHPYVAQSFNEGGLFYWNSRVRIEDIRDGTSQTIMVGERNSERVFSTWVGVVHSGQYAPWRVTAWTAEPPNHGVHPYAEFSSVHAGGVTNFAIADGSVQTINDEVDWRTFASLGTKDFAELVSELPY